MSVRDILKKSRPRVHPVEISTGTVYIRGLSGAGRQKFIDMNKAVEGIAAMYHVASLGLCEEDGTLLYDVTTEKGLVMAELELKEMDGGDLGKICVALYSASGLTSSAEADAEKK